MDIVNINQPVRKVEAGMPMFSQLFSVRRKLVDNMNLPVHSYSRIAQCSQASEMEWEGHADMPMSQSMDCSKNNNFMTPSEDRMNTQIFRLKNVTKFDMPVPASDMNGPFCDDIDRKQAGKKVVLPIETKNESPVPQENFQVVQCKKRPLKRTMMEEIEEQQNAPNTLDPVKFKITADLIQRIKDNKAVGENVCITYNPYKFSNITNLKPESHIRINNGSFGDVQKVRDSQTGEILIQKVVKRNVRGEIELERNEIEVPLQFLDAENISKFYGLAWVGGKLIYIMEDAGISLRNLAVSCEYSSMLNVPHRIEKIELDIFTGISNLAACKVTHCDIKPENICLNVTTGVAKLVDFGSSKTSQDKMTYAGITPEYLDPHFNKFYYELKVLKNKDYPVHVLEEKDDVFGAGVVALFLLMKVHPMIYHFTGANDYSRDPTESLRERLSVIRKISEMSQETLMQLLDRSMSDILNDLLCGVLNFDRTQRWTSKQAVSFLQERLSLCKQPPNKLSKQEQQLNHSQDASKLVSLCEKGMDRVLAQQNKVLQPPSLEVYQSHGVKEPLGIAFKIPASSTQSGNILYPPKLKASFSHAHMGSSFPSAQSKVMPTLQDGELQPLVRLKFQPQLPQEVQETNEYAELVKSFNTTLTSSSSKKILPVQQNQSEKCVPYFLNSRSTQRIYPDVDTGQCYNAVLGKNVQHRPSNDTFVVQGLLGASYNIRSSSYNEQPFEVNGNIPDISAIMQSDDERARRKIKGIRRSRTSQD